MNGTCGFSNFLILGLLVSVFSLFVPAACSIDEDISTPDADTEAADTEMVDTVTTDTGTTDTETADTETADTETADTDTVDTASDVCEDGCIIDALCIPNGFTNPQNICQYCDSSSFPNTWSNNDGVACNDFLFCTVNDACMFSICSGEPRECSDGIWCNGVETCDDIDDACVAGQNQCAAGEVCDVLTDTCVVECAGCVVDDICYGDGQVNPVNLCFICDIDISTTDWSYNDGASCDDGAFCTLNDSCLSGACDGEPNDCDDGFFCNGQETTDDCDETVDSCSHPGNPCPDDEAYCNGLEYCSEEEAACLNTGNPCRENEQCVEEHDACCTPNSYQACGGEDNVVWFDSCGNEGALVEDCLDENGTCHNGVCGCASGWSGAGCDQCLVYVSAVTGDDSFDGRAWDSAKRTLQAGLAEAQSDQCDVWVAAGTYKPNEGLSDLTYDVRETTFQLLGGVAVYGGFLGDELHFNERDFVANPTVLSGDIGEVDLREDNVFHVVTGADNAIIDGFIITDGNAAGTGIEDSDNGGGMINVGCSPQVNNCVFENNYSWQDGAGIYNRYASPTITNCTFVDNTADDDGGAMGNTTGGAPTVIDCHFENNWAAEDGGAMSNRDTAPTISGCTFVHNWSGNDGGAVCNRRSPSIIDNCTFENNFATDDSGAVNNYASNSILNRCTFLNNKANSDGGAMQNREASSPRLTNCILINNWARSDGGAIQSRENSSLVVINAVFSKNAARDDGGALHNNDSALLLINSTLWKNTADDVGGAVANDASTITVTNSILWGNTADESSNQIYNYDETSLTEVTYSNVENGCIVPDCTSIELGNIDADPFFYDPLSGDFRLMLDSPCINAGRNDALPNDVTDLDEDGDAVEAIPLDYAENPRVVGNIVDMGAYENPDAEPVVDGGTDTGIDAGL